MSATNDIPHEPKITTGAMHTLLTKPSATLEGMPPEMMTMILSCVEKVPKPVWKVTYKLPINHFKYIIDSDDIFSLRLTSNRIRDTTWYGFIMRYFTTRKHMLSRHSLQALLDISNHSTLRHCVRKVIIGPERVNSNLYLAFGKPRDLYDSWREIQGPYHDLVDEQEEFDASKEPTCMLRTIFKNFKNLNAIVIETAEENDAISPKQDLDWSNSWGTKLILQKTGRDDPRNNTQPSPYSVLLDSSGSNVRKHYDIVLPALSSIDDRKNWNLHLAFLHLGLGNKIPFDLTSPEWMIVKSRVRSIALVEHASKKSSDAVWVSKLLEDCRDISSLGIKLELPFQHIFKPNHWAGLRNLTLHDRYIQDASLWSFLAVLADKLETINFQHIELTSPGDTYEFNNPTWSKGFELMLSMPNLKKLELLFLRQVNYVDGSANCNTGMLECVPSNGSAGIILDGKDAVKELPQIAAGRFRVHDLDRNNYKSVGVWFKNQMTEEAMMIAEG
jgi:hypothetical protein